MPDFAAQLVSVVGHVQDLGAAIRSLTSTTPFRRLWFGDREVCHLLHFEGLIETTSLPHQQELDRGGTWLPQDPTLSLLRIIGSAHSTSPLGHLTLDPADAQGKGWDYIIKGERKSRRRRVGGDGSLIFISQQAEKEAGVLPFAYLLTFDLFINKRAPCAARFHHGSQTEEGKSPFP